MVDQRHQFVECRSVAVAPVDEQLRELVCFAFRHLPMRLVARGEFYRTPRDGPKKFPLF